MTSLIEEILAQHPRASANNILDVLRVRFGEVNFSKPTLYRWLERWREVHPQEAALFDNPNKARGRFGSAIGTQSQELNHPNQLWELDTTLADIVLLDGKRYALIGAIDVFSRRIRYFVAPTSSGEAIAALLRRCILEWGIPECIKTDNGKDYLSERLEIALAGLRVGGVPCKHIRCQPFNPKQKPHIERSFGIFCGDLLQLHFGYIGRNVEERQSIRARQMSGGRGLLRGETSHLLMDREEFQQLCDRWCKWYESQRPHSSLGDRTPLDVWTEGALFIPPTTIRDERHVDLLLAPAPKAKDGMGYRRVTKGCVSVKNPALEETFSYGAAELVRLNGQLVHVRFDPLSNARVVVYKDADLKEFICVAECLELMTQERRLEEAKIANREYRKVEAEVRKLRQEAKEHGLDNIAEEIQAYRDQHRKVVPLFPAQTQDFSNESLNEAGEALEQSSQAWRPSSAPQPVAKPTPAVQQEQPVPVIRDENYFCDLWRDLQLGKPISEEDSEWMQIYMRLPQGFAVLISLNLEEEEVLRYLQSRAAI